MSDAIELLKRWKADVDGAAEFNYEMHKKFLQKKNDGVDCDKGGFTTCQDQWEHRIQQKATLFVLCKDTSDKIQSIIDGTYKTTIEILREKSNEQV